MGNAVFLAAMLELPTMAYFTKLSKKVNCGTLIKISIILFLVKHVITYFADGMTMIYIAQAFQNGGLCFIYSGICLLCEVVKLPHKIWLKVNHL